MIQILRFTDQENATKYLELVHKITRERFEKGIKNQPVAKVEVVDENLMVIGVDASRRLVIKVPEGPRAGSTFVNRFVKGQFFVEVTNVAKVAEKSVDIPVTDEAIVAVGNL